MLRIFFDSFRFDILVVATDTSRQVGQSGERLQGARSERLLAKGLSGDC